MLPHPYSLATIYAGRRQTGAIEAWEVFPSDVEVGEAIGHGKFGKVYEGFWNGQRYASDRARNAPLNALNEATTRTKARRSLCGCVQMLMASFPQLTLPGLPSRRFERQTTAKRSRISCAKHW
jgi:hypothetical protein